MIALFFHRSSTIAKGVEGIGLLLLLYNLLNAALSFHMVHIVFLLLAFLFFAFARTTALYAWHPKLPRDAGLGLHFARARVACAYFLATTMTGYLFLEHAGVLITGLLLMGIFVYVNIVLITFYRQDHDPQPVNYYSRRPTPVMTQGMCVKE